MPWGPRNSAAFQELGHCELQGTAAGTSGFEPEDLDVCRPVRLSWQGHTDPAGDGPRFQDLLATTYRDLHHLFVPCTAGWKRQVAWLTRLRTAMASGLSP